MSERSVSIKVMEEVIVHAEFVKGREIAEFMITSPNKQSKPKQQPRSLLSLISNTRPCINDEVPTGMIYQSENKTAMNHSIETDRSDQVPNVINVETSVNSKTIHNEGLNSSVYDIEPELDSSADLVDGSCSVSTLFSNRLFANLKSNRHYSDGIEDNLLLKSQIIVNSSQDSRPNHVPSRVEESQQQYDNSRDPQSQLELKERENNSLRLKIKELTNKLLEKDDTHASLQSVRQKEALKFEIEKNQLKDSLTQLQKKYDNLTLEYKSCQSQIQMLKTEHSNSKSKYESDVVQLRNDLEGSSATEVKKLEDKINTLENTNRQLQLELQQVRTEGHKLHQDWKAERKGLEDRLAGAERDFSWERGRWEQKMEGVEADRRRLDDQVRTLQYTITSLKANREAQNVTQNPLVDRVGSQPGITSSAYGSMDPQPPTRQSISSNNFPRAHSNSKLRHTAYTSEAPYATASPHQSRASIDIDYLSGSSASSGARYDNHPTSILSSTTSSTGHTMQHFVPPVPPQPTPQKQPTSLAHLLHLARPGGVSVDLGARGVHKNRDGSLTSRSAASDSIDLGSLKALETRLTGLIKQRQQINEDLDRMPTQISGKKGASAEGIHNKKHLEGRIVELDRDIQSLRRILQTV